MMVTRSEVADLYALQIGALRGLALPCRLLVASPPKRFGQLLLNIASITSNSYQAASNDNDFHGTLCCALLPIACKLWLLLL